MINALFLEHDEVHDGEYKIYTDGSKTREGVVVGQISDTILHFWKQAPKLAHILLRYCSFDKPVSHLKKFQNSKWRPFFKMATTKCTEISHFS